MNTRTNTKNTITIKNNYTIDNTDYTNTFANFIKEKRECYNELYGYELSTRDLAKLVGIKYEVFRKILNQQKPTKKRDCIIAIGIVLKLLPGEIDEALNLYQYMPSLDKNNPRENFIQSQIINNKTLTIAELNQQLIQRGFPKLDVHNSRDNSSIKNDVKLNNTLSYKILKVQTQIPVDYFFGDQYDSLCTQYSPSRFICSGDMLLEQIKTKKHIHLKADCKGYLSSQIINNENSIFPTKYNSLDESGDYKCYFVELCSTVFKERQKILNMLNDTRNYQKRISAKLLGDHIEIFSEEFNYCAPELSEYYLMTYSNGNYNLYVYNESVFMYKYLSKADYLSYYESKSFKATEHYHSLDDINNKLKHVSAYSDYEFCLNMRKKAFIKLKDNIDKFYTKLQNRTIFIQNLEYIYDNLTYVLRYYKVEHKYNCVQDKEYGELVNLSDSAVFNLNNGDSITITFNDICRAFELGFSDIEEICTIKAKLGSIDSVLT